MPLELIYITNNPNVAMIAEANGVRSIMVDLETLGKEERQKNMNTVKSHHSLDDVALIAKVLRQSELMVRINPWHENSVQEIEAVIAGGGRPHYASYVEKQPRNRGVFACSRWQS